MNQVSLTIPSDDRKALVAGATMLLTMAGKLPEMELDDHHGGCGGNCDNDQKPWPEAKGIAPVTSGTEPHTPAEPEQPTSTGAGVELDADGLPWDSRIHSSSKAKTQKGVWKKKKGVSDDIKDKVESELRQLMAAPTTEPASSPAPVTPPPAPAEPQQPVPTPPPADVPTPPTTEPAPVTPPPAETNDAPSTFAEFLKAVFAKVQSKETSIETVNEIVNKHGVANMQLMANRPDLIPQVWAEINGG